jgi:glycosyltransferase involved in cell wall biosynthesis
VRILLINNLFHPEPNHLKGLAFAQELQRRGHYVRVLTGFPNYPGGRLYPGYRMRWTQEELVEGVPVTRVALYPSHDGSAVRRIASYVSVALSQAMHVFGLEAGFDVAHVYMGPITLMWPARLLRLLRGTRIVADVQDIWPESVTDSGMLRSGLAGRILSEWCRRAYAAADRLVVLSPGYRRALVDRGIEEGRIDVVYNWCDERAIAPVDSAGQAGVLDRTAFNVVYAGNLGKLQGIDTILDAAKLLAQTVPDLRVTLIGDGVEADRLARRVQAERIRNVAFLGRRPLAEANRIQQAADVLLVHLLPTRLTALGIPSKIQSCMALGVPLLVAASGEAARLVEGSGGGTTCEPGDPVAMAAELGRLRRMDAPARAVLGRRGREYYEQQLAFRHGVGRIEAAYAAALAGAAP